MEIIIKRGRRRKTEHSYQHHSEDIRIPVSYCSNGKPNYIGSTALKNYIHPCNEKVNSNCGDKGYYYKLGKRKLDTSGCKDC